VVRQAFWIDQPQWAPCSLFAEEEDLAAAYRRLVCAGFRSGEILKSLKRFAKNPDLLDGFEPAEEEDL
jgi:hypothetical protein